MLKDPEPALMMITGRILVQSALRKHSCFPEEVL